MYLTVTDIRKKKKVKSKQKRSVKKRFFLKGVNKLNLVKIKFPCVSVQFKKKREKKGPLFSLIAVKEKGFCTTKTAAAHI